MNLGFNPFLMRPAGAIPLPVFGFLAAWGAPQANTTSAPPPRPARTDTEKADKVVAFRNPDEYERVVDLHYRSLYLFALSLSRNEHDAWDLTHDTFVKWVHHQHRIRDRDRTKTWLFTTLYRQFLDQTRRKGRHSHFDGDEVPAAESLHDAPPPAVPDARAVDRAQMMRLLQALPEKYRAPITLFYLEDCSYKEIARILDIRIGTVMSRLSRAKALLAERLEDTPANLSSTDET